MSPTQANSSSGSWRRISHHELMQATSGFSAVGLVYKGILPNGDFIAVKVFNQQARGAFEVGCDMLSSIRHHNLTKILVLQFMPNGSLENLLYSHNNCLDILQRLNIMIDVASALEYLRP